MQHTCKYIYISQLILCCQQQAILDIMRAARIHHTDPPVRTSARIRPFVRTSVRTSVRPYIRPSAVRPSVRTSVRASVWSLWDLRVHWVCKYTTIDILEPVFRGNTLYICFRGNTWGGRKGPSLLSHNFRGCMEEEGCSTPYEHS